MKKLSKSPLVILVILAVVFVGGYLLFKKTTKPTTGKFDWKIVQIKEGVAAPNYELDVYLSGDKVTETTALELDASLSNSQIKVSSAEAGGFFQNPLTVKMDNKNLVFAIAQNPTNKTSVDPNKPVFKISFVSIKGFGQTTFSILPTSQIYVRNIGGATPGVSQFVLQK